MSRFFKQNKSLVFVLGFLLLSMSFFAQTANAACPGVDGTSTPVVYEGCSETKVPGENIAQEIIIDTPAGVAVGDLMIAAIAIDESHEVTTIPPGWTLINQDNSGTGNQAASFAVLFKYAEVSDISGNHTFGDIPFGTGSGSVPVQAAHYGWIMYFSGMSGIADVSFTPDGGGNPAVTPAVTTTSENNLILRLGGFDDDDIAIDTATLIAGHTTITADVSHDDGVNNGDSVSGGAAFLVQAAPGVAGAANFTNFGGDESWVTMTLAIEPLPTNFHISHAGAGDTCTPNTVNIRAADDGGNTVTTYTGAISLSTDTGNGYWAIGAGNGTLIPGPGDGTATYTFDPADAGVAVLGFFNTVAETVNFNVADGSIVEDAGFDPDLDVITCPGGTATLDGFICENNSDGILTYTPGLPSNATNSNRLVLVTWSGEGNLPGTPGATFDGAAMSLVQQAFLNDGDFDSTTEIYAMLNTNLPAAAGTTYVANISNAPNDFAMCILVLVDAEQLIPPGAGALLAVNFFTADSPGTPNVSTSITTQADNSFVLSATGNGTSGSYTLQLTELYDVQIGGSGAVFAVGGEVVASAGPLTVSNTASVTPNRVSQVVASFSPTPLVASQFSIAHNNVGGVCTDNLVTISAITAAWQVDANYTGTITLTTDISQGNWVLNTGNGAFNDLGSGSASYTFVASDNGQVILGYSLGTLATVNFDVTDGTLNESPFFDNDLVIGDCAFRISHSGTSDVCSLEAITITLVDGSGTTLTAYTGTINLTTSTGSGTWSVNTAAGSFSDPVAEDGAASYSFDAADNGVVVLDFRNQTAATVNINVSDGLIFEDSGFDPDLILSLCTFRISHSTTMTACGFDTVTFEVYDSGGVLAPNYTGTMSITTDTSNGNWVSTTGAGSLIDINPNDGVASYTFVTADAGTVDIVFTDETAETVNINLDANGIIEDPGFDPDLDVTPCLPTVTDVACYQSQDQTNAITIASSMATGGSRMVLMYIDSESLIPTTGATLDNGTYAMTLLRTEIANFGLDNVLEVYAILDVDLPAAGGTFDAEFTGSANAPAMCLVAVEGVEQIFPAEDLGTPADGQLNGSNGQNTQVASTTVTTLENNSIVISAVATGADGTTYSSSLTNPLWGAADPDPNSVEFFGNFDIQPFIAAVTVDETNSDAAPNRYTHIVLALAPIVTGVPFVTGYVPVTLFQTFAGNMNFRATGNTLRTAENPTSCTFFPEATGSTAIMDLPVGSTIEAAYLYWAGSGSFDANPALTEVDDIVSFGPDGSQVSITADDIFLIENPLGMGAGLDFFLGYKNVTGLISTAASTTYRLSDLAVQNGAPWNTNQTCLGGWGLVVVYENLLENLNVINLFHGFQPFQNSSFTLVPRNFRMATPDGVNIPNGQITHITFEGDDTENIGDEAFRLQNDPFNLTFDALTNSFNVGLAQYNNTVSRPIYDANLDFLPTAGPNGDGYEADSTTSYGADIDTYYIQGAILNDPSFPFAGLLYPFGSAASEQITTRYSAGQDLVLLAGEFISVTNAPIADLEVFVTESGIFKVNSVATGTYNYDVINNGNGAVSNGFADGEVILTGNLPVGMTINTITAPGGWNCTLATAVTFSCVFDIAADWTGGATMGELAGGESLPTVAVSVNTGDETFYPLLDNDVNQVARLAHTGGSCPAEPAGVQPDPTLCAKSPQFDNVNDLNRNTIDIDDLDEKTANNNNVDSLITTVQGIETDLGISKVVVGVLEENQPGQYLLTVTNFGPDDTTKTITVTDTLPNGLVPSMAGGSNWICSIASQDVSCTRTVSLAVDASTTITIDTNNIVAPAVEGVFVSNTAVVTAGTFNFDEVAGNNADTNITEIVGQPVASTEEYLISVNENSSIGGIGPFEDGDLVLYDPANDTAVLFMDESAITATNIGNLNAVHLLPNGHIILSSESDVSSTIAGVSFEDEDLVLYDPILTTATLIFDGSAVFTVTGNEDIDAVFVNNNDSFDPNDWDIVLSTVKSAAIGGTTFKNNDLVNYDVSTGTASVLIDGASGDVFNSANGDIDAVYIRNDDPDAYILSTDVTAVTIAISGTQETYTRDDLVEYNSVTVQGTNVFLGDVANGIFTPASGTRRLNAVHVIEDVYFGHFAIIHGGIGDTCSATSITISKHLGLSHTVETTYKGSIILSNDIGEGTWAKDASANGMITDLGGGVAIYTFEAADNGEVILFITQTTATTMNVNVTNGIAIENSNEDNNIIISDVVTNVTYLEQFGTVSYSNNDGTALWAGGWTEINDDGDPANGDVLISGGELRISDPGGNNPGITRAVNFSSYTAGSVVLSFDWQTSNVSPAESFIVEANDGGGWVTLTTLAGLTGVNSGTENITITGAPFNILATGTVSIRFLANAGYVLESFMLDNIQLATSTTDCGVGDTVDHYAISHSGTAVSCLAEYITITAHSISELITEPGQGVAITLNTTTGRGTWNAPINGSGPFSSVPGFGQATYTFQIGESSVTFPFNYTDPESNPVSVGFTVADTNIPAKVQLEAPTLSVATAGLRFFNDTNSNETYPTLVAGMPSIINPFEVLTVQAIQVSDDNPAICEDIFSPGVDVQIELAFECIDANTCSAAIIPVQVTNNAITTNIEPVDNNGGNGVNVGGFDPITLRFETFTNGDYDQGAGDFSYTGAGIILNYADAGALQIHGRYNIPFDDGAGANSGNFMVGSGDNNFVVRPFGYDIDFSVDRQTNGNDMDASSWAVDSNGTAYFSAGIGFDTSLRAISWQPVDDDGDNGGTANDGIPDPGADLFDNNSTPNYGRETDGAQNDMTVTHTLVLPAGGAQGTLSDNTFITFAANDGTETHSMTYSEVGIIDLTASLDSGDYLGSGQPIIGNLENVGRFYPDHFELVTNLFTPACTLGATDFTYMGQQFSVNFDIEARNAQDNITRNYFDGFNKLVAVADLNLVAIDTVLSVIDFNSGRFSTAGTTLVWGDEVGVGNDDAGTGTIGGGFIINRDSTATVLDGPYNNLTFAIAPVDSDGVAITSGFDIDIDAVGGDDHLSVFSTVFRYGIMIVFDAYGSEFEDLGIAFEIQTFDDQGNGDPADDLFIISADDFCTTFTSTDFSETGTYAGNIVASDIVIDTRGPFTFIGGQVDFANDEIMVILAPNNDGEAELEYDAPAWLRYEWIDGDDDYDDNPRANAVFGTYRGNDRIINWMEIIN